MGCQCLMESYFRYGVVSGPRMDITLLSAVDFGKHPLSREFDLGTDTRGTWTIIPGKPPDQTGGLFGGCASGEVLLRKVFPRKLATSTDLLFPMGKKGDCAKTCSFLLFIFFSFYFILKGGGRWTWNETLHFSQFDLIGEYFILLIGLVSNQFRICFNFPQRKCSFSSFSLLWLCSREDLSAQETKNNFCAGWAHGNSVNLWVWLHSPKKSIHQL